MHHSVAWRLSSTDATLVDQTPVQDQIMLIQNSHFVPQRDTFIWYVYVGAATLNRARFVTPKFRQQTTPWIRPIGTAIVPTDEPNVCSYVDNPLKAAALEEIELDAMQTTGGAAVIFATAGLAEGPMIPAPRGDIYTMRGTGATTVTAGVWTSVPITWQDSLPSGRYACVGLEAIGATCVAARLTFDDQYFRPGTVGNAAAANNGSPLFRKGGLGVWGYFNQNRMPTMEFCCNAADTAQEVYMDFIKVG